MLSEKLGTPRREWLKRSLIAGTTLLVGLERLSVSAFSLGVRGQDALSGGKRLGDLDFIHEPRVPIGSLLGSGLDGRRYADLAALSPEQPVVPSSEFYVRTRASELLDTVAPWEIRLTSASANGSVLGILELRKQCRAMGQHLMECAGNGREARFGLLSVAEWEGVPIAAVLDRLAALPQAGRVLISGFDHYPQSSSTSVEGASWIFSAEQLQVAGAFLALRMNGESLSKDHGAPVRLVVPGWYGCTCIKWVNEISVVAGSAPATSQMQEFAVRTHQDGVPKLAREFRPALIQQGAMPIRVEKWMVDGRIKYRVVGVLWGGSQPVKALQIRFNPEEEYVEVDGFHPASNDPWSFWWHVWGPKAPGTYAIRLRLAAPAVSTKRLDAGYFVRSVEVTEV